MRAPAFKQMPSQSMIDDVISYIEELSVGNKTVELIETITHLKKAKKSINEHVRKIRTPAYTVDLETA